jgi:CPA2 family monovalent cation:H+ antiporter-2
MLAALSRFDRRDAIGLRVSSNRSCVPLIATIAVSLAFAFVGGLVAMRLRLPPLVGYLLAGIVVGPFTPGFVADAHLAPQLAEIGVILLMFGVGTHFSIRDLFAVRRVALTGAFT